MSTLTIYYGNAEPFHAVGGNQCRLLRFAFEHKGWHEYKNDKATRQTLTGLEKRGCVVIDRDLHMFKINLEGN